MSHCPRPNAAYRLARIALAATCLHLSPAWAAAPVGTDNAEAIKENKRVAIDRFSVEFYTQLFGQGRSTGGSALMTAELQGISDTTRQAITQQAYQDTVRALKKAGFEVVDQATLAAQPLYKTLEDKYGKASPYVVEDEKMLDGGKQISSIVAPEGMKAYFQSGSARGDLSQRIEVQNYAIGKQQGELAKAVDATLLQVHVLASFGTVSATKNSLLRNIGRLGASAAIEAQPVLYAEDTQIQIINSGGARTFGVSHRLGHSGAVYLKEPWVAATNIFELRDTQSQGEKDQETAVNFLKSLVGVNNKSAGNAVVTAGSEEAYRSTYVVLIHDAVEAMVATLAAAR